MDREPDSQGAAVRRLPIGADVLPGGGVSFRVWAPGRKEVQVVVDGRELGLRRVGHGIFEVQDERAGPGSHYGFRLDGGDLLPDLASRFQPEGPFGLSAVVDPAGFSWTDQEWRGRGLKGTVIEELHIGTFTPEGTFAAASEKIHFLKEIGINAVELMPVNDWPGHFGWGYDGVLWFAPKSTYGTPDDLRTFVDKAHSLGIAVLLDVVYNHLGPEAQFFRPYSEDYFSRRYECEWGDPPNFDDENCSGMRSLVIANAAYWIDEFHFDGLRFDATQQIFDSTVPHVVAEMAAAARKAAKGRQIILVAENTPQDTAILAPPMTGGMALDGLWNEDFQRAARIAVTGQRDAYYGDMKGTAAELVASLTRGFLYQGQKSGWEKQPRGRQTRGIPQERFVAFIENHDQCANSLRGDRLATIGDPAMLRAMAALLLLGPQTPMLFQGQEWGSSKPFTYFVNWSGPLAEEVREGRQSFLSQFPAVKAARIPDPCDPATFRACVLDWRERGGRRHHTALFRSLLELRRSDPTIAAQGAHGLATSTPWPEIGAIRFHGEHADEDRLLVLNTGVDRRAATVPDPLFSAGYDRGWDLLWTSDAADFGGRGVIPVFTEDGWTFPGRSVVLLRPRTGEGGSGQEGEPR